MGRLTLGTAALVAILVAPALAHAVTVAPVPAGTFANGGFENDRDLDGEPDGWTVDGTSAATATRATPIRRSGIFALHVVDADAGSRVRVASDPAAVSAGESVAFRMWARADAAPLVALGPLEVTLRVTGPGADWEARVPVAGLSSSWREYGLDVVVPWGATGVVAEIETDVARRGAYFVDDVTATPALCNMVDEPGFEASVPGEGWLYTTHCAGGSPAPVTPGRTGATAMRLADGASACYAQWPAWAAPGETVTASVWIRATGAPSQMTLRFMDDDAVPAEVARVTAPSSTSGAWERLVATGPAAGADWIAVELRTAGTGTSASDWDDLGVAYGAAPIT